MAVPWEVFSIIAVVLFGGMSFCYYMSVKQQKQFASEASTRLRVLPMSITPTSDTLPVYSDAMPTSTVVLTSATSSSPPPPISSLTSPPSLSMSTVQGASLSECTIGAGGSGLDTYLPPPPRYQPMINTSS